MQVNVLALLEGVLRSSLRRVPRDGMDTLVSRLLGRGRYAEAICRNLDAFAGYRTRTWTLQRANGSLSLVNKTENGFTNLIRVICDHDVRWGRSPPSVFPVYPANSCATG
jgi:hypothetical protein